MRKNVYGYTLIEILVALTIVGLIFGVGYVGFREFSRRQALTSVARSIRGDLRLAQGEALAGKKPASVFCNPPAILNGYNFRVVSSSNYVLEANCTGGNVEIKNVTLASDVSISTPSPNPIIFKVVGQGNNVEASAATIVVTQAVTGNTRVVTITSGGEIK